jgi:hypothetical protein
VHAYVCNNHSFHAMAESFEVKEVTNTLYGEQQTGLYSKACIVLMRVEYFIANDVM